MTQNWCVVSVATTILLAIFLQMPVEPARSEQTVGGIQWLDTLQYQKPVFYPVSVPAEAAAPNKYYIDLTNGAGAACSMQAPCKDVSALSGKAGTQGGPAYVYMKGRGRLVLTGSLFGSAGAEVVIKPWPGDENPVVLTASGSGSPNGAAVYIESANVHHLVIDGGPRLQFKANGMGGTDNGYVVVVNSSFTTIARMEMSQTAGGGPILGAALGNGASISDVSFVNNEIHLSGGSTPYGVYVGGGSGCYTDTSNYKNLSFYNNIIRDICGRPIQLEPRNSANNDFAIIEGNAFHNAGKNTCGSGWGVSDAVGLAGACGASFTNHWVRNNLFFDIAGAFGDGPGINHYFTNNTVYNYGFGIPTTSSHAVGCYDSSCSAVIENNILLKPNNGVNPINRGQFATAKNICEAGSACGSGSIAATAAQVFRSVDSNSPQFLTPQSGSVAVDSGLNTQGRGVVRDYLRQSRPYNPLFDIGAFEFHPAGASSLSTPINLRVLSPGP